MSPLANCTKLEILDIHENQIVVLDLSPLLHCKELDMLAIDPSTTVIWKGNEIPIEKLLKYCKKALKI